MVKPRTVYALSTKILGAISTSLICAEHPAQVVPDDARALSGINTVPETPRFVVFRYRASLLGSEYE